MRKILQTIGVFYDMIFWGLGGIIVGTIFAGPIGTVFAGICGVCIGLRFSLRRIEKQNAERKSKQEAVQFRHRVEIKYRQKNSIDAYTVLTKDQQKQIDMDIEKARQSIQENQTPDEYAVSISEYELYIKKNPSKEVIEKQQYEFAKSQAQKAREEKRVDEFGVVPVHCFSKFNRLRSAHLLWLDMADALKPGKRKEKYLRKAQLCLDKARAINQKKMNKG
jgi:hypothetical protein